MVYICKSVYTFSTYISVHIFKFIGITSHAFSAVYRGQGTIDVAESVEGTQGYRGDRGP